MTSRRVSQNITQVDVILIQLSGRSLCKYLAMTVSHLISVRNNGISNQGKYMMSLSYYDYL
jgi:hypothetical protein